MEHEGILQRTFRKDPLPPQMDQDRSGEAVPSPFLEGTKIQYARCADELLNKATRQGECLICHLAPNTKGYVSVSFGRQEKWRAHRLIYTVIVGPIPEGMLICHSCDVRNCIEPSHLFLGTPSDNMRDMVAKGRQSNTDGSHQEERKMWTGSMIFKLKGEGLTNDAIAARLGYSKSAVHNYTSIRGIYHKYLR